MMQILPADAGEPSGHRLFRVRRIRPGSILGPDADPAFGPFSVMDRANLAIGAVVKMHEHVNDEILSYLWRGTMIHEDSTGHREMLTPSRLMMMNAGRSFRHEESTPDESVEMLQIFFRPTQADLDGRVQFFGRSEIPLEGWALIAGPDGSDAPLTVRQDVRVYDARLSAGATLDVPVVDGRSPWLYVMDGEIVLGDHALAEGQAATWTPAERLTVRAQVAATIVLFLVNTDASGSRSGTISGR